MNNEDCIAIRNGDKWVDTKCETRLRFVCEKRVCVANCKHVEYRFNEAKMKNRCSSDCHCDGERHCSSSKFCAGISRPNTPATITPISETEPKEIVSEMTGGKTFETSTNTPLAIHRPKFMSWIKEPLCTPIL